MPHLPELPDAAIGQLFGLLEAMGRRPGPGSVSLLAQGLHLDLDDLLPLLSAARQLSWVSGGTGRYELTEEGRRMAGAPEAERKARFRERAREVPLLRAILDALEAAAGQPVPREAILALLSGTFPEAEAERQFETAVNWGRYAELLDYDVELGCLLPPVP